MSSRLETISKKCTKRNIQIALGGLWILDGLLQLQHQMFTDSFANNVIAPAAEGQPAFISSMMHFWMRIFESQPVMCNLLIVIIQVGIGVLILRKQTSREGLIASIVWGLFVWYVGEGLGGLSNDSAWLLMGAPGAALLYAIISFGVLPRDNENHDNAKQPAAWLAYIWVAYWFSGAVLQLTPGQNTTADLRVMMASMADGVPGWISRLDLLAAHWLAHANNWLILLIILIQILIGALVLFGTYARYIALGAGILLSLAFWVVGQNLGGYYTGLATDPGTAPLVILLGFAMLGARQMRIEVS